MIVIGWCSVDDSDEDTAWSRPRKIPKTTQNIKVGDRVCVMWGKQRRPHDATVTALDSVKAQATVAFDGDKRIAEVSLSRVSAN